MLQASLLVCETNLSFASLEFVCKAGHERGVPVILEPVSVPKSTRWVAALFQCRRFHDSLLSFSAVQACVCVFLFVCVPTIILHLPFSMQRSQGSQMLALPPVDHS